MSTFKEAVKRIMGKQEKAKSKQSDVHQDKHILVVDDIEVNRSPPGEYDLILMDVQMPVLDGCGAARAIRVCDHPSAKSIPIIAVTANAFADDVRAALEAGMNGHLAKPIQTDQLKSVLQQVLE